MEHNEHWFVITGQTSNRIITQVVSVSDTAQVNQARLDMFCKVMAGRNATFITFAYCGYMTECEFKGESK